VNPARREPLLWLQLLGLAALPLEALLLILVLAGADPGPFPGFERVLAWALGALAPAVLFWRLPPDLWSLLLVQVPLRGRRSEQLRLSALQGALPLRVIAGSGAVLLLPLLWQLDAAAGLAWAWSPLSASPRLVVLLVSVPLLALTLWQWHQVVQALWLFTRPEALVEETLPLTQAQAAESRLNLGIPLLLLPPLAIETPAPRAEPTPEPQAEPEPEEAPEAEAEPESFASSEGSDSPAIPLASSEAASAEPTEAPVEAVPDPAASDEPLIEPAPTAEADADSAELIVDAGVAVPPEQPPEEHEGSNLDP
jgi:hypothetical protein